MTPQRMPTETALDAASPVPQITFISNFSTVTYFFVRRAVCVKTPTNFLTFSEKEYYSFNTGLELPEGGEEIFDEILQTINKYKQGDD